MMSGAPSAQDLANGDYLLAHCLRPATGYRPDIVILRAASTREPLQSLAHQVAAVSVGAALSIGGAAAGHGIDAVAVAGATSRTLDC